MYTRFFQLAFITFLLVYSSCGNRNLMENNASTGPDLEPWDEPELEPIGNQPSVWDITTRHGSFSTFSQLVEIAELEQTLQSGQPITVLAPTDDAFNQLPEGTIKLLLKEENKSVLVELLLNHVIPEMYLSVDLLDGETAAALSGNHLVISRDSDIRLSNATVTTADISASNGVVHVVDQVIITE